jgi:hypothetical protein
MIKGYFASCFVVLLGLCFLQVFGVIAQMTLAKLILVSFLWPAVVIAGMAMGLVMGIGMLAACIGF